MPDVKLHGIPIQATMVYEREEPGSDGGKTALVDFSIIVRGRVPNRQFIELTTHEPLVMEYSLGGRPTLMQGMVANHQQISTGSGEGTVYRHDITVAETPESAARRAAERAEQEAKKAAEAADKAAAAERAARAALDEDEVDEDKARTVLTSASVWGSAIQQLKSPAPSRKAPEEPLDLPQSAAVEAVLVNLRIDALIEQLRAAGVVSRTAVDHSFGRLVRERFVAEATPLIGEHTAKRAARQLLGE